MSMSFDNSGGRIFQNLNVQAGVLYHDLGAVAEKFKKALSIIRVMPSCVGIITPDISSQIERKGLGEKTRARVFLPQS